jgi:hypothetical protein
MGASPPGRNDPCHCGSGRKYKRCHLDADRRRARLDRELSQLVIGDATSQALSGAALRKSFRDDVMAQADVLNRAFRLEIADGLEGRAAAAALSAYMDEIEDAMGRIASRHSYGYWSHVTRRLPPKPLGSASNWTVVLYKRVLSLAILKYGQPTVADDEFDLFETKFGEQTIARATQQDVLDAWALEYLAYEYTTANQAQRRVGKGAKLRVVGDDFRAVAEPELQHLLKDVDRRTSDFGELSGPFGAIADREVPTDLKPEDAAPLAILIAVPNTDAIPPEKALRSRVQVPGTTNFVVTPLVVDGYRETLATLDAEVTEALGIDPELLIALLWALTQSFMRESESDPLYEVQLLKAGYLSFKRPEAWERYKAALAVPVAHLRAHFGRQGTDPGTSNELVERAIRALTWTDEARSEISLADRLPFKVFIDAGQFVLVDFAALLELLADIFRQVGFSSGESGNIRAANFEAAVASLGRRSGFEPWKEGVVLRHRDGATRELDVGFVAGSTLFVVECKAYAQNPKLDRGDYATQRTRQDQLLKYLDQARSLAGFLDSERTGLNYEVPPEVTRIEAVLCTPGVEFIWTSERGIWLTDAIPRICTPAELILALKYAVEGKHGFESS